MEGFHSQVLFGCMCVEGGGGVGGAGTCSEPELFKNRRALKGGGGSGHQRG